MAHPAISAVLMFFGTTGPAKIPLSMLVIFVAAKLMAELAERVGQPGIVGEILAGVLIGPSVLGWLAPNEFLSALSDLGAMFLLFRVGLEVKSSELMKVGGVATLVACSGVVVPFVMGMAILLWWGAPTNEAIFVGASMVATSVGITAQVLSAKGLLHAVSSKIILAAAVIDDVLGLLVLAVVSSLTHGKLDFLQLSLTALAATAFTVIAAKWGHHTMGRIVPHVERTLKIAESRFVLAMALLFALALLAVYTGVAAIVGAFLAGLALGESTGNRETRPSSGRVRVTRSVLPGRHWAARRSFSLRSPQDSDTGGLDSRGCNGVQVYRLRSRGARNGQGRRLAHRRGYDSTRRGRDGSGPNWPRLWYPLAEFLRSSSVHVRSNHYSGPAAHQGCLSEIASGRTR